MTFFATFTDSKNSEKTLLIGESMDMQDAINKLANEQFYSKTITIKQNMENHSASGLHDVSPVKLAENMVGKHTNADILAKHKISSAKLEQLLAEGMNHEMEHTSNMVIAMHIAQDHIYENLNYYKRLKHLKLAKGGMLQCKTFAKGGEIEDIDALKKKLVRMKDNARYLAGNKRGAWGITTQADLKRNDEISKLERHIKELETRYKDDKVAVIRTNSHRASEKIQKLGIEAITIGSIKYGSGTAGTSYMIIWEKDWPKVSDIAGVSKIKTLKGGKDDWTRSWGKLDTSDSQKLYSTFKETFFDTTGKMTADKLMNADWRAFERAGAESGDDIKTVSKYRKYTEYMLAYLNDAGVEKGTLPQSIFDKLEDENHHTLNEWLSAQGYYQTKPNKPNKNKTVNLSDAKLSIEEKEKEIDRLVNEYKIDNSACVTLAKTAIERTPNSSPSNLFYIANIIAQKEGSYVIKIEHVAEAHSYEAERAFAHPDQFNLTKEEIKDALTESGRIMYVGNKERMLELGLGAKTLNERLRRLRLLKDKLNTMGSSENTLIRVTINRSFEDMENKGYENMPTDNYLTDLEKLIYGKENIEDIAQRCSDFVHRYEQPYKHKTDNKKKPADKYKALQDKYANIDLDF